MRLIDLTPLRWEVIQALYLLDLVLKLYVIISYITMGPKGKRYKSVTILFSLELLFFLYFIDMKYKVAKGWDAYLFSFEIPILNSYTVIHLFVLFLLYYLDVELFVRLYRMEKNNLTNFSIKEAMDKLSQGQLFVTKNGQTLLVNDVMRKLIIRMTGQSGYDAMSFVKQLQEGDVDSACKILKWDNPTLVMLDDESVWSFAYFPVNEKIMQMTAIEVTDQHRLNEGIEQENRALEQIKSRMKAYGEKVDEHVKKEELLNAKISIHDNLGRLLIATRAYMEGAISSISEDELILMWKENLYLMKVPEKKNAGNSEEDGADSGNAAKKENGVSVRLGSESVKKHGGNISGIQQAAEFIGLKLVVSGVFPDSMSNMHLIHCGARECMTNAAHAGAKEFCIDVSRKNGLIYVCYTNDGEAPKADFHEGGGLSSLRKQVEEAGATMIVETNNRFALTIVMQDEE